METTAQEESLAGNAVNEGVALKSISSQAAMDGQVCLESSGAQPPGSKTGLVTWVCAFCTWENPDVPKAGACDACGKSRHAVTNANESSAEEEGGEEVGILWACIKCTFQNEPHAEACAMCQVVPGFSDEGSAPQPTAGGGDNLDKQLQCEQCSVDKVCETCQAKVDSQLDGGGGGGTEHSQPEKDSMGQVASQDGEGDMRSDPEEKHKVQDQQGGVEGRRPEKEGNEALASEEQEAPEPVKWSCQLCTFENQEPDIRCQLCTSPRPVQGDDQAQIPAVQSQNMCSMCGLIKPFGQPWKGGLCSNCRPVIEEDQAMDLEGMAAVDVGPSWSAPEPGPCGVCQSVVAGVLLHRVDGCGHQACSACLSALLHRRMGELPSAGAAAHQHVLTLLKCCEPGCERLLGAGSLSCSLPGPSFLALSHWLLTLLSGLYTRSKVAPSSGQGDITCTSGDQKANPGAELEFTCCAEDCPMRGRPRSYRSGAEGDSSSSVWAFCEVCPQVTCLACGKLAGTAVDNDFRDHRFACPLVQTFEVFQAVVALEEAFQLNEGDEKERPDDGEGRSNKKQKTEQADTGRRRIVWAKGTGFGGNACEEDEPYEYAGYSEQEEDEEGTDEDEGAELAEEEEEEEEEQGAEDYPEDALLEEGEQHDFDDNMEDAAQGGDCQDEQGATAQVNLGEPMEAGGAGAEASKAEEGQELALSAEAVIPSGWASGVPMEDEAPEQQQPGNNTGNSLSFEPVEHAPLLGSAMVTEEEKVGAAGVTLGVYPITPSLAETPPKAATSLMGAAPPTPPGGPASLSSALEKTLPADPPPLESVPATPTAFPQGSQEPAHAHPAPPLGAVLPPGAVPSSGTPVPSLHPVPDMAGLAPAAFPDPPPQVYPAGPALAPASGVPVGLGGWPLGAPSDKRKERKDKVEAREEKLREREREADRRLASAAGGLTEALRGDEFMGQPTAGTTALLRGSWVCRILFRVLHRCSLLDMGHNPEREQLYLALLHLVRTLGAHPDTLPILLCEEEDQDDKERDPEEATKETEGDCNRGQGLLGFVVSGISRAFAANRGKEGEVLGREEKSSVGAETANMEQAAESSHAAEERGIKPNPNLRNPKIVLEGGKSVLSALGDLNRQARIVQQGLKNGMAEGENEGDFGVGIVGLVLEVSDCYEELSRRAAHWDSQRIEAQEEREALMALHLSAKEAEGRSGAGRGDMDVHREEEVAGPENKPRAATEDVEASAYQGTLDTETLKAPETQIGDDVVMTEPVAEEGAGEPVGEEQRGGEADSGSEKTASKPPLKERVMKGLKGMLISTRKNGKQKEDEQQAGGEKGAQQMVAPNGAAAGVPGQDDRPSREERIQAYKAALKPLQFQEMALIGEDGQYEHNYRNEAGSAYGDQSGSGAHSAKRQLRMLREIASLATTLPLEWESSVHIRVDEGRMDLIKALIIGPEDTPYSNGIWLFDALLPHDYPERPPKVKFLTTGGGTVRFNPNLYDCGKVCLSLLGTWSGPSWKPGKSTLLQVLISLQSLIFVKDPYYNEPGYESRESTRESELYNQDVRLNAMKHALLAPLKNPPRAFQDVIKEHFRLKKGEIGHQVDDWINRADSTHKEACMQVATQIKEELAKLVEAGGRATGAM